MKFSFHIWIFCQNQDSIPLASINLPTSISKYSVIPTFVDEVPFSTYMIICISVRNIFKQCQNFSTEDFFSIGLGCRSKHNFSKVFYQFYFKCSSKPLNLFVFRKINYFWRNPWEIGWRHTTSSNTKMLRPKISSNRSCCSSAICRFIEKSVGVAQNVRIVTWFNSQTTKNTIMEFCVLQSNYKNWAACSIWLHI